MKRVQKVCEQRFGKRVTITLITDKRETEQYFALMRTHRSTTVDSTLTNDRPNTIGIQSFLNPLVLTARQNINNELLGEIQTENSYHTLRFM